MIQFSMRFFYSTAVILHLLSLIIWSNPANAVDPAIRWQVLKTPHFEIIYDANQQEVANDFATSSEAAFATLVPIFREFPAKTIVWLNDSTDLANGSATPIPYPSIIAHPTLPSSLDTISEYGHWSQELMLHEYTHILSFEPAHGIIALPRFIFGRILSPNALMPRWYLEGKAVETETLFSRYGRLRSLNQNAILRAMALDNTLRDETLPRINETSITSWPQGARPYLFGSLIWNSLVARGEDMNSFYDLTQRYSRRLPYFIHGPSEDLTGKDYNQLLNHIYDEIEKKTEEQKKSIESHGRQTDVIINQLGLESHSPQISPEGLRLIFIGRSHNHGLLIQLLTRSNKEQSFANPQLQVETLVTGRRGHGLSWLPSGEGFVFDDINTFNNHYYYSDLYSYDFKTKKKKQLTFGLRAREPSVSPDGQHIFFVQLTPGSTRLVRSQIDGSQPEVLYTPTLGSRISHPQSVDKDKVIFLERSQDGQEILLSYHVPSKRLNSHSPQLNPVVSLQRTPNGPLLASGKNGIINLYQLNNELSEPRVLTNTLTGVFDGEWDPFANELLFSQYRGDGLKLHALKSISGESSQEDPLRIAPLVSTKGPQKVVYPQESSVVQENYKPYRYLLPHYWMPFVYPIEGGMLLTAQTGASDPVGLHSYTLFSGYNTFIEKPNLAFSYAHQRGVNTWGISAAEDFYYVKAASNLLQDRNLLLSFKHKWNSSWSGGLAWSYRVTGDGNKSAERHGPRISLGYSDLEQKGDEISPEKGKSASISLTQYYQPESSANFTQLAMDGSLFYSQNLPPRHVIALSASASFANSDSYLVGATTRGVNYSSSDIRSSFLLRGYPSGTFVGKSMLVTSEEYRFPLFYPNWGWGSLPGFFRRAHLALFSDQVTLDGTFYNQFSDAKQVSSIGEFFSSVGAEINAEITLFYHYPASLRLGLYYGLNEAAYGGFVPFVGIGL